MVACPIFFPEKTYLQVVMVMLTIFKNAMQMTTSKNAFSGKW
jgi:hypothetical protein